MDPNQLKHTMYTVKTIYQHHRNRRASDGDACALTTVSPTIRKKGVYIGLTMEEMISNAFPQNKVMKLTPKTKARTVEINPTIYAQIAPMDHLERSLFLFGGFVSSY